MFLHRLFCNGNKKITPLYGDTSLFQILKKKLVTHRITAMIYKTVYSDETNLMYDYAF